MLHVTANTEASKAFLLIAGHIPQKPKNRKAGCYQIHDNIENVFGSGYIRQSIILGNPVRRFSTTSSYVT